VNITELVSRGEAIHEELGREYYLTLAGLKPEPAFQEIYDRYPELVCDDVLATVKEGGSLPLLEWIVGVRIGRKVAPLEERQLEWEQAAVLQVGGREVPYLRATIELANSADREYRLQLDQARAREGARGLGGIKGDRLALEHAEMSALGYSDYVSAVSALSGIDLDTLGSSAVEFLDQTQDMYRDSLARVVKKRLGLGLDQLMRADTSWTFRADEFDAAFPPDALIDTAIGQMREMDLDAEQGGRVLFDTEERDGKQPRAFCVPVRVPEEVYLVIRPHGGHNDYRTFWHELGHAMHFSSPARSLPFEARWLGDSSVTEGFAMLWDHLTLDTTWLRRYTDLGDHDIRSLTFELAVQELHLVRRYAAKILYELSLHRSDLIGIGPEYVSRLSDATLFRYSEDDYLGDVDPGFYSARYVRAWQLESLISEKLRQRFDEDWYRNPQAGEFVHQLMSRGQGTPADGFANEVAGVDLTFDALIRRVESLLA
jgi:hypothetical protein